MEDQQMTILNAFVTQQIINILKPLENNLITAIELISKSNSPTLTSSIVSFLNDISADTVRSINELIIDPELGKVENNYIVLYKYFSFNSSNRGTYEPIYDTPLPKNNVKKICFQLLYLQEFILTIDVCNKHKLAPNKYNVNDISSNVIENLTIIINIINRVIKNYEEL